MAVHTAAVFSSVFFLLYNIKNKEKENNISLVHLKLSWKETAPLPAESPPHNSHTQTIAFIHIAGDASFPRRPGRFTLTCVSLYNISSRFAVLFHSYSPDFLLRRMQAVHMLLHSTPTESALSRQNNKRSDPSKYRHIALNDKQEECFFK